MDCGATLWWDRYRKQSFIFHGNADDAGLEIRPRESNFTVQWILHLQQRIKNHHLVHIFGSQWGSLNSHVVVQFCFQRGTWRLNVSTGCTVGLCGSPNVVRTSKFPGVRVLSRCRIPSLQQQSYSECISWWNGIRGDYQVQRGSI